MVALIFAFTDMLNVSGSAVSEACSAPPFLTAEREEEYSSPIPVTTRSEMGVGI